MADVITTTLFVWILTGLLLGGAWALGVFDDR
jgi:hypothetical protein